ncbi:MAG: FAD-binding oxidoreductase, partial [Candidatus Aenigmatarchaeota archaeon]
MKYEEVTSEIVGELEEIAGEQNVHTGESEREEYSKDESPQVESHRPKVIVKPENAEQVSEILYFANASEIPVTPRGGGTGLSGGAVPVYGGILLSLENMDKILEIDEDNLMAVVEPGVEIRDLYDAVEKKGFHYPVYPGEDTATVGGTVATNAGGMKAVKYGVTRDNVAGLEAVLPTGEIIKAGGKFIKSSTGYDLRHLITGSEGTLAVVTKIILKLSVIPQERRLLIVPFENM